MGRIIGGNKKATKASSSLMKEYHSDKQKITNNSTVKHYLLQKNPDCDVIGDYIGIRLKNTVNESQAQDICNSGNVNIVKDKSGNYYVVVAQT